MVKKKMDYGFSEHYGVLGVIALVAIVAVVALIGGGSSASSQGLSLDDSNVVGDARYRLIDDPRTGGSDTFTCRYNNPNGPYKLYTVPAGEKCPEFWPGGDERYRLVGRVPGEAVQELSREEKYADERYEDMERSSAEYATLPLSEYVDEREFTEVSLEEMYAELEVERDLAVQRDEADFTGVSAGAEFDSSSAITPDWGEFGGPVAGAESCFTLTQSMFTNRTANYTLNVTGTCFTINSDIAIGSGRLFIGNDAELDCNNNELVGTGTVIVKDNAVVRECIVKNRDALGMRVKDNAKVYDSEVYNTVFVAYAYSKWGNGFDVLDSAEVIRGKSINNDGVGFRLENSAVVTSSVSKLSGEGGFYLRDSSSVVDGVAQNNALGGFIPIGSSSVVDSVAQNNALGGFFPHGSSSVVDSVSRNNGGYGFHLISSSSVSGSSASNNGKSGFIVRDNSKLTGVNTAGGNVDHGFNIVSASQVETLVATQNGLAGVRTAEDVAEMYSWNNARGVITVADVSITELYVSDNDEHGVFATVDSDVTVGDGIACENEYSLFANCAFQNGVVSCGTVSGSFDALSTPYVVNGGTVSGPAKCGGFDIHQVLP